MVQDILFIFKKVYFSKIGLILLEPTFYTMTILQEIYNLNKGCLEDFE